MKKLYVIARKSTSTTSGFKFLTNALGWTENPESAQQFSDRSHAQEALGLVKNTISAGLPPRGYTPSAVRVEIETKPSVKFVC